MKKIEILALLLVLSVPVGMPMSVFFYQENIFRQPGVIQVVARQWEFEPSTITVELGSTVSLLLTSADVVHNFVILNYSIDVTLYPGKFTELEFQADLEGQFEIDCTIFCGSGHYEMSGLFIVTA